ncbi:MAG: TIM barrel protein [Planctomycetes bacterium]|nr:TIM barrel protein [Planctomycetota bacterium]
MEAKERHPAAGGRKPSRHFTRRGLLRAAAVTAAAGWVADVPAEDGGASGPVVTKGRIRQSVMGWCFNPMPTEELAKNCKAIGLVAMEGIGAQHYPMIRKLGLQISLVGSHGFRVGPFSRDNHEECVAKLREGIDRAVEFQCRNVITFTGMRQPGISDEQGTQNCLDCWKRVIGYAEDKGINLCLEHLNSRDDTHPMKGHPGYFGDDVDFCVDLIRRVDSPRMKLLFDIYHVQIMNGDVIRRIRQYKDHIAHYHTAGVPGRGELDESQEINYPAVMRAILETGYEGYVAQEFIPTWPDKIAALRHAAGVCDV